MTLLAALLLLARPASYTATARIVADARVVPLFEAADFLDGLADDLRETPEARLYERSRPDGSALALALQEQLIVRPHTRAGWLEIEFAHEVPALAARVANTAAQRALRTVPGADVDVGALRDLEAAERALRSHAAAHPGAADAARERATLARRRAEQGEREQALDERIALARARLADLAADDLEAVGDRQGIRRAREQLDRALLDQGALAGRYGPRHLRMIAAAGEVEAARQLLRDEVEAAREQIERLLADLQDSRAALAERRAELVAMAEELDAVAEAHGALALEVEQARRRYEQVEVGGGTIAEAPVPLDPDPPRHLPWLAALFGLVALAVFALQGLRR